LFAIVISVIAFPVGIPVGLVTAVVSIASALAGGRMIGQSRSTTSIESPKKRKRK